MTCSLPPNKIPLGRIVKYDFVVIGNDVSMHTAIDGPTAGLPWTGVVCGAHHAIRELRVDQRLFQRSSYADYMELSLQLQYNNRGRK